MTNIRRSVSLMIIRKAVEADRGSPDLWAAAS
jgi:hypothetical protein